jgi:hypothetical protein
VLKTISAYNPSTGFFLFSWFNSFLLFQCDKSITHKRVAAGVSKPRPVLVALGAIGFIKTRFQPFDNLLSVSHLISLLLFL